MAEEKISAVPNSDASSDWVALVEAAEPRPFLLSVQLQLQSPQTHFKTMQQSLSSVFFKKIDPSRSLDFLLCCLELLVLGTEAITPSCATSSATPAAASGTPLTTLPADARAETVTVSAGATVAVTVTAVGQGDREPNADGRAVNSVQSASSETLTFPDAQKLQREQQQTGEGMVKPMKDTLSGTMSHLLLELLQQQQQSQSAHAKRQHKRQQEQVGGEASTSEGAQDLAALLPAHRTRVLRLFAVCCSQPRHARIALKVAQVFYLTCADVADPKALATAVSELLTNRVTITPGLGLVMHFQALLSDLVDRPALFARLVAEGKEGAAEKWAAGLSRADQVIFVEICIAADRLKAAARATRLFGLKAEFPDIEARYRRAALSKLASKRVWEVAATFAGSDTAMQLELLQQMVEVGEAFLADEYRKRFGLPPSVLNLDPVQLAAQEAARAERYLPLALPPDAVLFVDGPVGLRAAAAALSGARVVGIDVEWRASQGQADWDDEDGVEAEQEERVEEEGMGERDDQEGGGEEEGGEEIWRRRRRGGIGMRRGGKAVGGSTRASLLQVATHEAAILFDLPALCSGSGSGGSGVGVVAQGSADAAPGSDSDPELDIDSVLAPLFGEGGALVLGFGLAGDLAKLASSYPHVVAFQRVGATLDLFDMWKAYVTAQAQAARPKNAPPVALSARAFQAGLSTLAASLMGKPLDKAMQVSDWEARPLSPRQITYAAQDAHVLVRLWDAFRDRLPEGVAERVAAEKTQSFITAVRRETTKKAATAATWNEPPSGSPQGKGDADDDGDSGRGGSGGEGSVWRISGTSGSGNTDSDVLSSTLTSEPGGKGRRINMYGCTADGIATLRNGSKVGAPAVSTVVAAMAAEGTALVGSGAAGALSSSVTPALGLAQELVPSAADSATGSFSNSLSKGQIKALTKAYGGSIGMPGAPPTVSGSAGLPGTGGTENAGGCGNASPGLPQNVAATLERHGLNGAIRWILPGSGNVTGPVQCQRDGASGASVARGTPDVASSFPRPLGLTATVTAAAAATATAADAASTLAVPLCRVAKSVAVLAAGKPWLAVVRGDRRLDWHKVAAAIGVGRRALRVATLGECVSAYGFAPGTLPPFGHPCPLPVLVDAGLGLVSAQRSGPTEAHVNGALEEVTAAKMQKVQTEEEEDRVSAVAEDGAAAAVTLLYCGSGVAHAVVQVSYEQLLALTSGRPVDIADDGLAATAAAAATAAPAMYGSSAAIPLAPEASGRPDGGPPSAAATGATGTTDSAAYMGATPTRFLLDSMLGRLCRWLRCLGLDAEYVGRTSPGKVELAKLTARAAREGRIFLTRDQRLAERRDVAAPYVLHSDDAAAQLDELVRHFNVRFDEALVMSRCNACNAAAFQLITPREAARVLVPPRVFELVEEFWCCGCCGKIFWMGPKSASAIALVGGMLARSRQAEEPPTMTSFNDGYPMTTGSAVLAANTAIRSKGSGAVTEYEAGLMGTRAGAVEFAGRVDTAGAYGMEQRPERKAAAVPKGGATGSNPVAVAVVAAVAAAATAAAAMTAMAAPRWAAAAAAAAAAAVAAKATESISAEGGRHGGGSVTMPGVDGTSAQETIAASAGPTGYRASGTVSVPDRQER